MIVTVSSLKCEDGKVYDSIMKFCDHIEQLYPTDMLEAVHNFNTKMKRKDNSKDRKIWFLGLQEVAFC